MAFSRFYQVEKEINGVKYKAQFNGLSYAVRLSDETFISETSSNHSSKKVIDMLFSDVIVEPSGLSTDDFDSMEELNEVVAFATEVAQGKFRDSKNPGKDTSEI